MTTTTYRLKHPIDYREGSEPVTLTQLDVRRPTGADMLLIDSHQHQPMRLALEMICALTGHPMVVVGKLDAEDIGPLGELVFANVEGGPRTGGIA